MPSRLPPRSAFLLVCLLTGCDAPPLDQLAMSAGEVVVGAEVACDDPSDDGFARFREEADARRLDPPLGFLWDAKPCFEVLGGLVSGDLDGDGDLDLLFHNRDGFPDLYANDGDGGFDAVAVDLPVRDDFDRSVLAFSAVDLDGDALPEVVVSGADLLLAAPNQGGLRFGPWEVLWDDPAYPRACFNSMSWGDLDRDGDLDVVLPGIDPVPTEGSVYDPTNPDAQAATATTEVLLLNGPDGFGPPIDLHQGPDGSDGLSILAFMTDRDHDGDTDLFISADRADAQKPPSAFFRNDGSTQDGAPLLVNDAAAIGADTRVSGMGMASNDLNGDGLVDYCMSDVATALSCLLSDGAGGYYEAGRALGLTSAVADVGPQEDGELSTWSIELVDLDNDGLLDAVSAAGGAPGQAHHDIIWRGTAGGFVDSSVANGMSDPANHFGMVADDFDGDGFRDLVFTGWEGRPTFWSNTCGSGGWLELVLEGPPGNTAGFGARVEVSVGDRVDIQEVHGLRSLGQSSPRIHVGLGALTESGPVAVYWPDGLVTRVDALPASRYVTVRHPDAPQ